MNITQKLLSTNNVKRYHRHLQTGLTLIIGIGLSIFAWLIMYNWEEKSLQAELQNQLDKIASNIEQDIKGSLEVLQATSALNSVTNEIKQQDFETFVKSSIYRHPSLQAIAWLPRITNEQTNQREAFPLQITERTKQGKIAPAQQRAEYFPVYYNISFKEKELLSGFDFASNPIYKSALQRAVDNDEIVVSGKVNLFKEQESQPNILVFAPVYNSSIPRTSRGETLNSQALRRNNLRGYILGILQVEAIVKIALEDVKINSINLSLQDVTASENERFLAISQGTNKKIITASSEKQIEIGQKLYCRKGSACTHIINIENRRWLIQLLQAPDYITYLKHWRSCATLIIGILITIIVTIYLLILLRYTDQIEKVVGERTAQSKQLKQAFQKLQHTQTKLVQTEKMSTLGLLVAGIAHEINNPINFISGNLQYANNYTQDLLRLVTLYQKHYSNPHPDVLNFVQEIDLDFLINDMQKLFSSMEIGTERIVQLVLSLRNFSRLDESQMKAVNIHEGIDSTLLILQHKLKTQPDRPEIEIVKKYGDLPLVNCYAGQLNQVFMNIIANAIDALDSYYIERGYQENINHPSQVIIETEYLHPDYIKVRISDNGTGMTEDMKKRLFEPFFTTKPAGKGTGLGLSISYQIIVENHKGALWCESVLGKGTEFCVSIPVQQEVRQSVNNTQTISTSG